MGSLEPRSKKSKGFSLYTVVKRTLGNLSLQRAPVEGYSLWNVDEQELVSPFQSLHGKAQHITHFEIASSTLHPSVEPSTTLDGNFQGVYPHFQVPPRDGAVLQVKGFLYGSPVKVLYREFRGVLPEA